MARPPRMVRPLYESMVRHQSGGVLHAIGPGGERRHGATDCYSRCRLRQSDVPNRQYHPRTFP